MEMLEMNKDNCKSKGNYKPVDKLVEFIYAKGNINFITNIGYIDAGQLTGLGLDGVKLKLTIFDDGTANFDEVIENGVEKTTFEQRSRLLETFSEKTISSFRNRMVINELDFISDEIDGKTMPLYLAVDYVKPIDKLAGLFDDDSLEINDEQSNKIDMLLSLFDDDDVEDETLENIEVEDEKVIDVEQVVESKSYLEDQFIKMKQDKIDELSKQLDNKNKDVAKFQLELKSCEKKINDANDDIKLLEDRLDSLKPDVEFNGYYFFVSERTNEKIELPQDIYDLINNKVSKVKGINSDAFMKLFENGEYVIKIGVDAIEEYKDYTNLSDEVAKSLKSIGIKLDDNENLVYIGDMVWGEIVNKMIKKGFKQNPEFDKNCGSNSYKLKGEQ